MANDNQPVERRVAEKSNVPYRLWLITQDGSPLPGWYRQPHGDALYEIEEEFEFVRFEPNQPQCGQCGRPFYLIGSTAEASKFIREMLEGEALTAIEPYLEDLERAASLVHRPPVSERCGECGHHGFVDREGICRAFVKWNNDAGERGIDLCGHKCVVPATGADYHEGFDDAAAVARTLNNVATTGTGTGERGEVLHWRFRAGVEETMCGLSVHSGAGAALLPEAATCPECKAAFVGYKLGRADAATPPAAAAEGEGHHCPHCGRRMRSEFDEDVGIWYECDNCDYREMKSSAPTAATAEDAAQDEIDSPLLAGLGHALSTITSPIHDKDTMPDVEAVWAEFWKLNALLTSTIAPGEGAKEAARKIEAEWCKGCNDREQTVQAMAVIIAKHCAAPAETGEVERLRRELEAVRADHRYARQALELLRQYRDRCIALLNPASADESLHGAIRNLQQAYVAERDNAVEARSTTIQSCIDIVNNASIIPFAGVAYVSRDEVLRELEALMTGEGEDGPTEARRCSD